MSEKRRDAEKQRQWQRTIAEAARSGLSVREFCRRHRLPESRFYWWSRKLKTHPDWKKLNANGVGASFAWSAKREPASRQASNWSFGMDVGCGSARESRSRPYVPYYRLSSQGIK